VEARYRMQDAGCSSRDAEWRTQDADSASSALPPLPSTLYPLPSDSYPTPATPYPILIIGAGIAGIQAALDIANSGHKVVLVERQPSIGGHMAQLSETFPTLDCSQCILTPRTVEAGHHENITLLTYSTVERVEGMPGISQSASSARRPMSTGASALAAASARRSAPGASPPTSNAGWASARSSIPSRPRPCPTSRCLIVASAPSSSATPAAPAKSSAR
jgi:hypothetical protein